MNAGIAVGEKSTRIMLTANPVLNLTDRLVIDIFYFFFKWGGGGGQINGPFLAF